MSMLRVPASLIQRVSRQSLVRSAPSRFYAVAPTFVLHKSAVAATEASAPPEAAPTPKAAPAAGETVEARCKPFQSKMQKALRENQEDQVFELYKQLCAEGLPTDGLTTDLLIEAHANEGQSTEAIALLRKMEEDSNMKPTNRTYNNTIRSCLRDGKQAEAFQLYEDMVKYGVKPDSRTFNFLITLCTRAHDFERAYAQFAVMKAESIYPSSKNYETYILGCLRNNNPTAAQLALQEMEAQWRIPSDSLYTDAVRHFLRLDNTAGITTCLLGLQNNGNKMDPRMLRNCEFHAKRVDSRELQQLCQSLGSGDSSDPRALNQQLYNAAKEGNLEEAFDVLRKYSELDPPTAPFTNTVRVLTMKCADSTETVDAAYFGLQENLSKGVKVPVTSINVIIEACAQLNDLDRAFGTFAEMGSTFDLQPDLGTFNALLKVCVGVREASTANRIFMEIEKRGLVPDAHTYTSMCAMQLRMNNFQEALAQYETVKRLEMKPTEQMYVMLMRRLVSGRYENRPKALELLEDMESVGLEIRPSVRALFDQ